MVQIAIVIVIVAVIIAGIAFSAAAAKKRREALAGRLGFSFSPDRDRNIDDRYRFLDALRQGSNRYACNILSGNYQEKLKGSDTFWLTFCFW